jgi:hypothetical protein
MKVAFTSYIFTLVGVIADLKEEPLVQVVS